MCMHHQVLCCFVFVTVGVGPASIMVGNLVAGKRIAQAAGRELGIIEDQDMSRKVNETKQLTLKKTNKKKQSLTRILLLLALYQKMLIELKCM